MERGERLHRWRPWVLLCLLPPTIYRINLVHGLGPALQIAEGQTVELPAKTHRLLGGGELKFTRKENGLHVLLPENFTGQTALALKITS